MNRCFNKYDEYNVRKNKGFVETFKNLSSESPAMGFFFIIGLVVLLIAGFNELNFRLRYIFPPVYVSTYQKIDVSQEPIQIEPASSPQFLFTARNGEKYDILPMADYSISAIVVAKNSNLWLRGIMNSHFDNIALIDLGLLCGNVANDETLKYVRFRSKKTLGSARELRPMPNYFKSWQAVNDYLISKNLSLDYLFSHMSHVHVIPANDNVMSALSRLHKRDFVKLEGYLVDMDYYGSTLSKTSLSRSDTNPTSRGYGACEVMYVARIQIGNKIYK